MTGQTGKQSKKKNEKARTPNHDEGDFLALDGSSVGNSQLDHACQERKQHRVSEKKKARKTEQQWLA